VPASDLVRRKRPVERGGEVHRPIVVVKIRVVREYRVYALQCHDRGGRCRLVLDSCRSIQACLAVNLVQRECVFRVGLEFSTAVQKAGNNKIYTEVDSNGETVAYSGREIQRTRAKQTNDMSRVSGARSPRLPIAVDPDFDQSNVKMKHFA